MKRFLTFFFVTLGVIFFLLILVAAYFYITDPWNLKPLLFGSESTATTVADEEGGTTAVREPARDANPMLNEQQEAALETVGINPADLPSEITPAQEACFVERLGAERVEEIKAGDSPTAMEIISARSCVGGE